MKYTLITLMMISAMAYGEDQGKWVGVWVWGSKEEKKPGYWMGQLSEEVCRKILNGEYKEPFFSLNNVCFWDSEKLPGELTKWSVKQERDEADSGTIMFRVEKIDKIKPLNGDPRKVIMIKDKNGNLVNDPMSDKSALKADNM